MLIPQEKIDEAKRLYDGKAMEEIVEYLGVAKWDERTKKGSCPWHSDSNPSFIWNEKNNSFHCFSCNRNYGIIDLYLDQGMTYICLLYTSPSPRDKRQSRMPSSA